MASYFPTREEDKPRLTLFQIELLLWYHSHTDARFELDKKRKEFMISEAEHCHQQLLDWAMIEFADGVTEAAIANGLEAYRLSPRGREHLKRLVALPLPVGRVVWTLPEESNDG